MTCQCNLTSLLLHVLTLCSHYDDMNTPTTVIGGKILYNVRSVLRYQVPYLELDHEALKLEYTNLLTY